MRDLFGIAVIVAGTHVLDTWTHNNYIVVGAFALICAAVVAWWLVSYWRSQGWI